MYICDFSRSVGAGKASTRNTRGLTRSVIALIVPPFPAPSRPSNTMQTLRPASLTHSCSLTNSMCNGLEGFGVFLVAQRFVGGLVDLGGFLFVAAHSG